jgi:aminopeptidase N
MAAYLAFIALGQYDIVRRNTPAGLYLAAFDQRLDPQTARVAREAVERTPEIAGFLSQMFGPYPFGQLGGMVLSNAEFSSALENQTRPVYGPKYFRGSQDYLSTLVHELAHQWFGDSVSVHRWRDIWLNEGFATYAEWLYSERTGGPTAQQIAAQQYQDNPENSAFWQVPPGDPGVGRLFSGPVYRRGAMALQALRTAVGDEHFFAALRAWVAERRGGNGTVQDFLAPVERISGKNVDDVAQTWLYHQGRPAQPPG